MPVSSHFRDEQTESQRGDVTHRSWKVVRAGQGDSDPGLSDLAPILLTPLCYLPLTLSSVLLHKSAPHC